MLIFRCKTIAIVQLPNIVSIAMYMLLSNRDCPIAIYHTYQDLVNAGSTLLYIGTTHKSQQLIAVKLGDYHAISGGVMH